VINKGKNSVTNVCALMEMCKSG